MNEVHDVQPGHIYQPGNKKEVRLVYRILSGPYCGRHQKSFSLTEGFRTARLFSVAHKCTKKWGVAGAWDAAQQAKAYMLQTGRLPPSFASPYSRSKLTNASANAIVLSKPLQPPRPLIHPGTVAGGHPRADAAALLASAATGAHISIDAANAAIAAAASRFLPLDTFAVAAAARSLPPHPTHGDKDGAASALSFPAFSDGLAAPFPSFLPPPTFPGRTATAPPPGGWGYLSSVHATLAAAAAAQRSNGIGSAEALARRESGEPNSSGGHEAGSTNLGQESSGVNACVEDPGCSMPADAGHAGAPMVNSYAERVGPHPSDLLGLHMLPGAPGPPPPFAGPGADGAVGTTLPTAGSAPPAAANNGAPCTTAGDVNPAAAAATAFTLLQLAEQNAMIPQPKDQQQLNQNTLQHFMLLQQLQMMQEKQQKDIQQQGGHESLCPLKPPQLQTYSPAGAEVDNVCRDGTETAGTGEDTGETADTERELDAACTAGVPSSAESDLTRAGSLERWPNENCSPAAMGSTLASTHEAAQMGQGNLACGPSPETIAQGLGSVSAVPDTFALLHDQQQHHPQQQEPHKEEQQEQPQNGQVLAEEGRFGAASGMHETLRDLLIAASLQQQRLHQQQFAIAEHMHNAPPHVSSLAMKGLPVVRQGATGPPAPGMLNISALASLLPGAMLPHKHQTAADGLLPQNPSPNHTEGNSIGGSCCVHTGPGGEHDPSDPPAVAEGKASTTPLSGDVHAGKDARFPPRLSVLWGLPQLDPLSVKSTSAGTTTAAAAGHCGAPGAASVGPSLDTASALASLTTLDGDNFALLNDSAAAASAARLKGLGECGGMILQHPAVSSPQGTTDVEGESEARSSCQSGNGDECDKAGEEPFQPEHISLNSRQPSLLQNLSPLRMLPASSAAASPLRLAGAIDRTAVNVAVPLHAGGHCPPMMHPGQQGGKLSSMTERAVPASGGTSAENESAAALQTCSSPNNTPSRISGSRVQPCYTAAALAEACPHLGADGCGGTESALLSVDTGGQNTREAGLVGDIQHVRQSMVDNPLSITGAHDINPCGAGNSDAGGVEEGMCNPTFVRRDRESTERTHCAIASVPEGLGSSIVCDELAVGPSNVDRNSGDTEEENSSNGTQRGHTQELSGHCTTNNLSTNSRRELRTRSNAALSASPGDTAAAPETCWVPYVKRTRTGSRCAYGDVSDSLSGNGQIEEHLGRSRSKATEETEHTSASDDAGRTRMTGKHQTRRKMCL